MNLEDIDVDIEVEDHLKEVRNFHENNPSFSKDDIFQAHISVALWGIYGKLNSINKKLKNKKEE